MAEKRPIVLDSFGGKQLIQTGDFIPLAHGGTGAVTQAGARIALGLVIGTDVQAYHAQIAAMAALATTGSLVRTGANTFATRSLQPPSAGITVNNGDGVSGNPTLELSDDLAAVEGLASAGFAVRTGANTWSVRSLTVASTARLTVTNSDGVTGNVQFDLAQLADGGGGSFLKFNRDTYGRVSGTSAVVLNDLTALLGATYLSSAGGALTNFLTLHADPVSPMHAATRQYVDNRIQGLDPKQTATVATTGALAANTYSNGDAGVGATITLDAVGVLTIDTHTTELDDLVLVKDESDQYKNGLYRVVTAGAAGAQAVLVRTSDMDKDTEFSGGFIPVGSIGLANKNTLWLANPIGDVIVGTTAIPFSQLNGATALTEGNGIQISGNAVAVRLAPRLVINGQNIDLASGVIAPGTGTKITFDTYGRVIGSATATPSDIGAQPENTELSGLASLSTTGLIARTGVGTFVARTIQAPAAGIIVNNPDGVATHPTIVLANDLAAVEALAGTGMAVRSGADTWVNRSLAVVSTNRLVVTNADGVGGNPTLDLAGGVVAAGTYDQVTVNEQGQVVAGTNTPATHPTTSNITNNEATTVGIVHAVYSDGGGTFRKANGNSDSTSQAIGITKTAIPTASVGQVASAGEVTATTNEWDQVTGQSGGLTPGSIYFLDNATAGHFTSTPPGSGYLLPIGQAISTTKLVVRIGERIQL